MADKHPQQADGGGSSAEAGRDVAGQMKSGGQSQGKAYPNDAPKGEDGGVMGHGGQSEIAYHGDGRLGHESTEAAAKRKD